MKRTSVSIVLAGAAFFGGIQAVGAGQDTPAPAPTHVVTAGETLWSIAGEVAADGDRRVVMHQLIRLNDLPSPTIMPGQTLILPRR